MVQTILVLGMGSAKLGVGLGYCLLTMIHVEQLVDQTSANFVGTRVGSRLLEPGE